MLRWKSWLLGAMALLGLMFGPAQAGPSAMQPPALSPLLAVAPAAGAAPTCYWYGHRRYYRHYGWRHRHYGWRRPYGYYHRGYYGWRRPYGYRGGYYGWHRPYGYHRRVGTWHRPWGWRHHRYWHRW